MGGQDWDHVLGHIDQMFVKRRSKDSKEKRSMIWGIWSHEFDFGFIKEYIHDVFRLKEKLEINLKQYWPYNSYFIIS